MRWPRRVRRALGLPRLSWQVHLAVAAAALILSYLAAFLLPNFLKSFYSYQSHHYEPKDFQRGEYLEKRGR